MTFISTFIVYDANNTSVLLYAFSQDYILLFADFVDTWLETIFSCIKFVAHLHFCCMV
jgi:hypothetical protein